MSERADRDGDPRGAQVQRAAGPRRGRIRPQHGDLLDRDRPLAHRRARARDRRLELLRHTGAFSAFTIAFQVPNLVRSLFADAALSAAFVPVFTELLEQERRKEASRLASTLFFVILAALGALTALFIVFAGVIMPLFTGAQFTAQLDQLTVGLSRVLFPIVLLLGLNGLVVGILNAYEHFAIPALAPLVWNVVIIGVLVAPSRCFDGDEQIYAYAIGVARRHDVQLRWRCRCWPARLPLRVGVRLARPARRASSVLMLPVTIGLGLINFDLLDQLLARHARLRGGAARDRRRVPHLHAAAGDVQRRDRDRAVPDAQPLRRAPRLRGLRRTTANGDAPDLPAADPGGGGDARAVRRRSCDSSTSAAIRRRRRPSSSPRRCSGSPSACRSRRQPAADAHVLLPAAAVAHRPASPALNIAVNVAVRVALYKPFGIAGIVVGTGVASAVMTLAQAYSCAASCTAASRAPDAGRGDPDARRVGAARRRRATASGRGSTRCSGVAGRPDRLGRRRAAAGSPSTRRGARAADSGGAPNRTLALGG